MITPRVFQTMDAAYRAVLAAILTDGQESAPRGMRTRELIGASFAIADAAANLVTNSARRVNHVFSAAEWLWMLLGRRDVASIAYFNANVARYSDDGVTFFGAYGPCLAAQLPYVVRTLRDDPDSRQAVATIWQQSPPPTRDVPCTISLQFLLRGGHLHAVGSMRSNDAWLGTPYDVFNFTRVQAYVAAALGAGVGSYTHVAGSLHLYERDWDDAARAVYAGVPAIPAPRSPALTWPVPPGFAEAFAAAANVGPVPAAEITPEWIDGANAPWSTYLGLLLYRTTRDRALLRPPYDAIMPEDGLR